MAKVKTPLLSFSARGTIGGSLTFQRTLQGVKVYPYKKPTDRRSPSQLLRRSYFQTAITWWHTLTSSEQAEWTAYGNEDC